MKETDGCSVLPWSI